MFFTSPGATAANRVQKAIAIGNVTVGGAGPETRRGSRPILNADAKRL